MAISQDVHPHYPGRQVDLGNKRCQFSLLTVAEVPQAEWVRKIDGVVTDVGIQIDTASEPNGVIGNKTSKRRRVVSVPIRVQPVAIGFLARLVRNVDRSLNESFPNKTATQS